MERIEKSVQVNCPVDMVYNEWTQFEDLPKFMDGVKEVKQLDDTHVRRRPNAEEVRFEPLGDDRTCVYLTMEYDPEGALENIGDALGAMDSRVQSTVDDFKEFIESRAQETGAWRDEVHGGEETAS